MSSKPIVPQDIARLAERLHDQTIPDTRAQIVADELNQLNATARSESLSLAYDVDAFNFAGVLQRLRRPRRSR